MKTKLVLALSFSLISLNVARADVLSERVVLEVTGTNCPNSTAKEVRAVPLSADGKLVTNNYGPYVVPAGYALEITDLSFTVGWLKNAFTQQISVLAQNRSTNQSAGLYAYRFGPSNFRPIDQDSMHLSFNANQFVSDTGTIHVPFESGLLVSYEARVCVMLPSDTQIFDAAARIFLRGKLHKIDTMAVTGFDTGTVSTFATK